MLILAITYYGHHVPKTSFSMGETCIGKQKHIPFMSTVLVVVKYLFNITRK
jgi:hypothetical protein